MQLKNDKHVRLSLQYTTKKVHTESLFYRFIYGNIFANVDNKDISKKYTR